MQNTQNNLQKYQNNINLPQDLTVKPLALVGFSGLDTLNNAIHKSIWETFTNRAEKAPILYKLIGNDHEFPVLKPKRNSYDWYIPKGILKRNWMSKHLYEIPAVIVVFYELDWKDSLWNEKMIECASRVQSLRAALEERNTRIVVVLIQNSLPVPEDPLATERAVALCSSCELNSQSLYVLPHGQHQLGYTIRLENAFFEFAQTYYHNEVKNIKLHKEHLNKSSHQHLFVRHQFKMGFLNEIKQDIHTAHKHYTHAYNNLLDIRVVDTNALEIRTIAGFINYKICRLMFTLNLPRDAISQFKAHIDRFKIRTGFQELGFEHYAWLSKQYEVFGDIFDEAVKLGLPAVQTQHPGLYYQQTAQYAILRKTSCQELCSTVIAYPYPDPLEGVDRMEFYGQYPWRPGKVTAEPPDPQLECNGIHALQYLERQINHSALIISLYGLAISQYKIYKCPRTRRHLVLQMADEYYCSKDFGKALTLLTHMLSDYREEKWWNIISQILEKAIRCAYLTANVQDYILLAIEILSSNVGINLDDKKRIYENLNRIFKKQIPYGDPKLSHDILQNAMILWQPVFTHEPLNIPLDTSKIFSCVETKARFIKRTYEVDHNVTVEIFIRSTCPFPLTFSKVSVMISTPSVTSEFAITKDENVPLTFHLNETKRFLVEFQPDPNDINKEIQIDSVSLLLGTPSQCLVGLKFNGAASQATDLTECFQHNKSQLDFDNIKPLFAATVVPRDSKITVHFEHLQPALVGEWYEIKILISNNEKSGIKDLVTEVTLAEEEAIDIEFSTHPAGQIKKLPLTLSTPDYLDVTAKTSTCLYLRAHKTGQKNVQVKITYTLDNVTPVVSVKNEVIPLPIVDPFEVKTRYVSMMMSEVTKFYVGEKFGVMPTVRCLSPYPIVVDSTSFEFLNPVKSVENVLHGQLGGKKLNNEEIGAELFLAVCEKSSEQNVRVGQYTVKWKRENGLVNTSRVQIFGYHCDWIPLNLSMTAAAHGFVRTPMIVTYHLKNQSSHLVQLDVGMEASEAFMFAGYRQFNVSVLPHSSKSFQYNLYPLIAGSVVLPKLSLTIPENSTEGPALRQDQLNQLIDRCIPTHLYVMPQIKGTPELPDIVKPRKIALVG